jgi:hypothetical protein
MLERTRRDIEWYFGIQRTLGICRLYTSRMVPPRSDASEAWQILTDNSFRRAGSRDLHASMVLSILFSLPIYFQCPFISSAHLFPVPIYFQCPFISIADLFPLSIYCHCLWTILVSFTRHKPSKKLCLHALSGVLSLHYLPHHIPAGEVVLPLWRESCPSHVCQDASPKMPPEKIIRDRVRIRSPTS